MITPGEYANSDIVYADSTVATLSAFDLSGKGRMLVVYASRNFSATLPTSMTVGGTEMVAVDSVDGHRTFYLGEQALPDTGNHDIVATYAASDDIILAAVLFTGVKDKAPEASLVDYSDTGGTAFAPNPEVLASVTDGAVVAAFASKRFSEDMTFANDFGAGTEKEQVLDTASGWAHALVAEGAGDISFGATWGTTRDWSNAILIFESEDKDTSVLGPAFIPGQAHIAHVADTAAQTYSGTTDTVSVTPMTGNTLILTGSYWRVGGGANIDSVTSPHGAWVRILKGPDTNNGHIEAWVCSNVTGGTGTITLTNNAGSFPIGTWGVSEFSGLRNISPVDQIAQFADAAASTETPTGITLATTQKDELCIAIHANSSTSVNTAFVSDPQYTEAHGQDNAQSFTAHISCWRVINSRGVQLATATNASLPNHYAALVTLKGAKTPNIFVGKPDALNQRLVRF